MSIGSITKAESRIIPHLANERHTGSRYYFLYIIRCCFTIININLYGYLVILHRLSSYKKLSNKND